MGTAQGSALSPLLGNVYLHYTLDLWFERDVKPRLLGKATLLRYADDLVIAFERGDDAQRVMRVLSKRMERFCLRLHPDKTRLLDFRRPPGSQKSGQPRATPQKRPYVDTSKPANGSRRGTGWMYSVDGALRKQRCGSICA